MNTLRIDKLQCRKYRLFWICWDAIAVWMIACIVNTVWLHKNQEVLDVIGLGIMIYGIPYLLLSLGNFSQKKKLIISWKTFNLKKYRVHSCKTFRIISCIGLFIYVCVISMFPESLNGEETNLSMANFFLLFFTMFVAAGIAYVVYYVSLLWIGIFNIIIKLIYFTTIKLSGRIRRIGIDFILMLLALVSLMLFPAWLANTFVIISISSFLYDVYKIADFERQQEQMLCNCSRMKNLLLCMKKRSLLRKLMINLGLFN